MIQENNFKNLEVRVRGGGKLVTHRPVFSDDGGSVYLIQSSTLLSYSTKTSSLLYRYTTPNSTPIANIHVKSNNRILIFTQTGWLIELEPPTTVISSVTVNMSPEGWIPISLFTDFMYPGSDYREVDHFLALGYPQDSALPVLYSISNELVITKLCWSVVPSQHSAAVSRDGRFVVAIQEGTLFCKDMTDLKNCKWHSSGTRKFTCVAIHPTLEFVCATGDNTGRVLIWNNVMVAQSPAKTVFHWHTLPVVDLCFSPEGTHMYSGGGECTLVKWDTTDCVNKRTLPRMGLPILHVSSSPDGELVAVSHQDNSVQLVDPYNKVVGVVKNFTCFVESTTGSGFPAGVNVDPTNGCLVLNGKPGWLQCYDFNRDSHVYDIDVCQQNYVTAEREGEIPNCVVNVVGFSRDGDWMGTAEQRKIGDSVGESRLKFWKRDKVKGVWTLNTCVEWPHDGGVKGLQFGVGGSGAVTCGGKGFKIWGVTEIVSVVGATEYWVCEATNGYKDLESGGVSVSSDGSLVCGAFGRILTLWDCEGAFKLSLCHSRLSEDIRIVAFGGNVSSHLVLGGSCEYVAVWDVITASLLWVVNIGLDSVAVDRGSGLACASSGFDFYVFSLLDSEPLGVYNGVSKSKIRGVGWVGTGKLKKPVFLNGSDELCGLGGEPGGDGREVVYVKEDTSYLTGYGVMVAQQLVSGGGSESWGKGKELDTEKGYAVLREIMDCSPHTMASVSYYCTQLLRSLSTRTNEAERLAQMEELVMSTGKTKITEDHVTKVNKTKEPEHTSTLDLDEIVNEDTTWITSLFKK